MSAWKQPGAGRSDVVPPPVVLVGVRHDHLPCGDALGVRRRLPDRAPDPRAGAAGPAATRARGRDAAERRRGSQDAPAPARAPTTTTAFADVREQLDRYFAGDLQEFDVELDWTLARGFHRACCEAMLHIPYGTTVTYAELAADAGSPRAVRAAGQACATNPIAVIGPCHRVRRHERLRRLRRRPRPEGHAARARGRPARRLASPRHGVRSDGDQQPQLCAANEPGLQHLPA